MQQVVNAGLTNLERRPVPVSVNVGNTVAAKVAAESSAGRLLVR